MSDLHEISNAEIDRHMVMPSHTFTVAVEPSRVSVVRGRIWYSASIHGATARTVYDRANDQLVVEVKR